VITHELSHHWFGNLVTMKWWNDLWLNESFADFVACYSLSNLNLTKFNISDAWILFNSEKSWGYREDQLPTTHPIATEVKNTDVAENIFDGITYAKGAATIK
jgi:aminopeptidase N